MFKNKLRSLLIILMAIFIGLSPISFAVEDTTTGIEENAEQATKAENSSKDNSKRGDQYIIGDTVVVDYVIDGNLYILANNVTIKSQIIGNAFIAANTVKVTEQGYISNTLYVASSFAQISGIVSDVYSASENLEISGYIYRDLHCAGEKIDILGTVGRNASIASDNISFEKTDNTSSDSKTAESITAKKRIMGNLKYLSKDEKDINKDYIEGTITFEELNTINIKINPIFLIISFLILVFAVWGLLKWLAPRFMEKSSDLIAKKLYKTILLGLAGLILLPIIAVLLILGVLTSPVGFLLLIAYVIMLILSEIIFTISLANFLAKKFNITSTPKTLLLLLVVTLALYGLELVPVLAIIVSLISTITGLGIIIRRLVSKEDK